MKLIQVIVLTCLAFAIGAEPQAYTPAETADPKAMMSAGFALMKFSDAEKTQFGEIVAAFMGDVQQRIVRESRRNEPELPRRIKRRLGYLFDDLDERVKVLVNPSRLEGYQLFKAGLVRQFEPSTTDSAVQVESFRQEVFRQSMRY